MAIGFIDKIKEEFVTAFRTAFSYGMQKNYNILRDNNLRNSHICACITPQHILDAEGSLRILENNVYSPFFGHVFSQTTYSTAVQSFAKVKRIWERYQEGKLTPDEEAEWILPQLQMDNQGEIVT